MTYDHLISRISIPAGNIHRIKGENNPSDEAPSYGRLISERLPSKKGIPQFDLVILGMGGDGHTASIFPHQISLWHSNEICEVADHPDTGQQRITLTGKVINNAEAVAFLVTGADKQEKVSEIFREDENSKHYPATLVAPTSGNLVWFLDAAASNKE